MSIAANLEAVRAAVARACSHSGRNPADAHILAVSKYQPAALIEEAYRAGQRDFGENYVQELVEKSAQLAHLKDLRWHLIGHLQTKKAKQLSDPEFPRLAAFHAVDSEKIARELGRRLTAPLPVFLEVNIDGEASKAGVSLADAPALAAVVRSEPKLQLKGLMCMPAPSGTSDGPRAAFRRLAALARELNSGGSASLELSMGMSGDFEAAVEAGAHWVRIGTRIFGERPARSDD